MQQMVGIAALKMASPARPIRVAVSGNPSQMGLSSAAVLAQRDVKTGAELARSCSGEHRRR